MCVLPLLVETKIYAHANSQKIINMQKFSFFLHEHTRPLIVTDMTSDNAVSSYAVCSRPVHSETLFIPRSWSADFLCVCVCVCVCVGGGGGCGISGARTKFSSSVSVLLVGTIHQCSILIYSLFTDAIVLEIDNVLTYHT